MDASLSTAVSRAAAAIRDAEVIVIGAGAGMGVDSGLPDFRGDQGFWKAYPPYERLGISFEDAANPEHFKADPAFGWGFYGHRLGLYRRTVPHAGFAILLRWVTEPRVPFFVYTSNVDGQFQKAGFHPEAIAEIHGSIHHLQCSELCTEDIWQNRESVDVDESTMRARNVLRCPRCGAIARPNILMFGDFAWAPYRGFEQKKLFDAFLASQSGRRIVAIELGAGTAIPSVRRLSETIAARDRATLIRVNPRESQGPEGTISVAAGALEGLRAIDTILAAIGRPWATAKVEANPPPFQSTVRATSLPPRPDLPCPAPGERPLPDAQRQETGPFLDRMFSFRLADGRRVSVKSFGAMNSNYSVLMEGGMSPRQNAEQREGVIVAAKRRFGDPVIVIEPVITPVPNVNFPGLRRERLPWIACMARLAADPLGPDDGLEIPISSELTLVWWQDSLELPLAAEIERAAASVNWAIHAEDVCI